jgi:hypothetical protein
MKKKSAKPNPQNAADKAFTGSDRHTLDDLKLEPWTPQRIWAAQLMGMSYPNLGKAGRNALLRSNVYPNAVKDVAIFLWLSTRKPETFETNDSSEITVIDAEAQPEMAAKLARDFAIERGIHLRDSAEFWDAYNKFWEVMQEIENVVTQPKGSGPDEDEEIEGPKV